MMATGVARPSAQGQLMTRTEIALARAKPAVCPTASQMIRVTSAIPITTGTNIPDTRSAIFAIGAFVAAASLTILMIWARVVSSPTLVALQRMKPDWLVVAADTLSPGFLSTGIDSPVRAASFTAEFPSIITPSTGMFSPGRTRKISSVRTSDILTSVSIPPLSTTAVCGASFMRLLRASVVLPLDLASSILPTVMRVSIIAADSK